MVSLVAISVADLASYSDCAIFVQIKGILNENVKRPMGVSVREYANINMEQCFK